MASIPQISNPVTGKGFAPSSNSAHREGSGELFDVLELAKPVSELKSATEQESGGRRASSESKEFLPVSVKIAKDPTMAVESLKHLISGDLLTTAKENGYTELYGELDSLTKTLFLKPGDILSEILLQEKSNTTFSGNHFFNLLRSLLTPEGVKEAFFGFTGDIEQFLAQNNANEQPLVNNPHIYPLKANVQSAGNTLLDNIKIAVGNLLKTINYIENKDEILSALSSNMKFLSKYFAPNKILSEDLRQLAEEWAKSDAAKNFSSLRDETLFLLKNVSESLLNTEQSQVLIPLIIHNLSRYNTGEKVINEHFAALLAQIPEGEFASKLTAAFKQLMNTLFGQKSNPHAENHNNPTNQSNYTTNQPTNQYPNANFYEKSLISSFLNENLSNSRYLTSLELDEETINSPIRAFLLGKTDGKTAINDLLCKLINSPSVQEALSGELAKIDNLTSLVEYLNDILRSIPDIQERKTIFEGLREIINNMAETNELPPEAKKNAENSQAELNRTAQNQSEKQSVIKPLVEFIEKNIDHSALKTINNYNASNLLQSLINAPGVFTPLAHYIIPMQIDDTQTFGELWVDKDAEGSRSNGEMSGNYHLFLTFDVETVGRFEVDLVAAGQNVNLSLLYPEEYKNKVETLTKKVNRIIAGTGYTSKSFITGILKKPHNLTEVFPSLNERRSGFNVKV